MLKDRKSNVDYLGHDILISLDKTREKDFGNINWAWPLLTVEGPCCT